MPTSDRLREIQQARVRPNQERATHHSRFQAPANLRACLWIAGAITLAASALGASMFSAYADRLEYAEHEINEQVARRMPYGPGTVKIQNGLVYLGAGLFQLDATAADDVWQTSLSLTSQLQFDPLASRVMIENPDTTVSKAVKSGRESGDDAAEYVPQDWSLVQAVVRTTTNFATGETFSAMQFENKAKRAAWALPIFEIPARDRPRIKDATVNSVAVEGRSIVLDISDRRLTPLTALCLLGLIGSAAMLLVLRSYPDLARG